MRIPFRAATYGLSRTSHFSFLDPSFLICEMETIYSPLSMLRGCNENLHVKALTHRKHSMMLFPFLCYQAGNVPFSSYQGSSTRQPKPLPILCHLRRGS